MLPTILCPETHTRWPTTYQSLLTSASQPTFNLPSFHFILLFTSFSPLLRPHCAAFGGLTCSFAVIGWLMWH